MQVKENIERMRPDLICDYEEADRMLVGYASQVNNEDVMVRSPPGNIDLITLFVYYAMNCDSGTFIKNDMGPKRKNVDVNSCKLPAEQRSAIIGLYFSGHNYFV